MRDEPELLVPQSELLSGDWIAAVKRAYGILGVIAMALALWIGLSELRPGHFKDALLPFAVVAICWNVFGWLVSWIAAPLLKR